VSVRLAVLGDSIAWGQGASRPTDTLAPRLAEGLGHHGIDALTQVLAVPGARSTGLASQVSGALAWMSDVVVMVIGANDLTHLVPVPVAVAALGDAVRRLRAAGAQVVVAPAPDLSAVPHVPMALRPLVQAASEQLRTQQARVVLEHGGLVADRDQIASRAFVSDPSLFSADRFHPSSAGYAVIAASILPDVLAALRAVPR